MARILVIDSIDGDRVREVLQSQRHFVVIASAAAESVEALAIVDPHLVVMDHQLSDGSGLTMLMPKIRPRPLIVLSAADDQQTRVLALRAGADDFVAKPWDEDELLERVAAVLRRCYRTPHMIDGAICIGALVVEYGLVHVDGVLLDLTKTEHLLLTVLAQQVGTVIQRAEIIKYVYGTSDGNSWHTVESHLGRLRRKFLDAGLLDVTIRTIGGGRGLVMNYAPDV